MGKDNVISLSIDVSSVQKDLDSIVNSFKAEFANISKLSESMGLDKTFTKGIDEAIKELHDFQAEYKNALSNFAKGKLDVKTFNDFQKSVNTQIESITQRVTDVEKTLKEFQTTINGIDGSNVENRLSAMIKEYDSFKKEITGATEALKIFQSMVSASGSQTIKVNTSKVDELESKLQRVNDILGESLSLGSGKTLDISFGKARQDFEEFVKEYKRLKEEINNTSDKSIKANLQTQLNRLLPNLGEVINTIKSKSNVNANSNWLSQVFNADNILENIEDDLVILQGRLEQRLEKIKSDVKNNTTDIKESTEQTVSTFQFKDGGIRIPVRLDQDSIRALKPRLENVIDSLSEYSAKNPVNVTMRLFSLRGSRDEQREVNRELSTIQANIANLEDGKLKDSLNDLVTNLETQFRKSLKLNVEVGLSEKSKDVKKAIKEIQQTVNEEIIQIYPEFVISDDESKKLQTRLKELQEGFTFNITNEIKEMADSLRQLLENNNVDEWSKKFIDGITQIQSKLNEIKPLVDSLLQFTDNKNKKVAKDAQEDISIIDKLTSAIDELYKSVQSQNNISIDLNLEPLLEKLSELKGSVGIIRLELGHLQTSISNISGSGMLEVLKRIEELINHKTPLKPNVIDSASFTSSIEQQIDTPVHIPVKPLLSSVNTFVAELQKAIEAYSVQINVSTNSKRNLRDEIQNPNTAAKLQTEIYNSLNSSGNGLSAGLNKQIAASLVSGFREGLSSTADMLKSGLGEGKYKSMIDKIIGDPENLKSIKNIANDVVKRFNDISESSLNITEFLQSIDDEILRSGKVVQIPIGVNPNTIDSFIAECNELINSQKENLGLGEGASLEDTNKQITSFNKRMTNLQKKISDTWENWYEFGQASESAKNVTNQNLDAIINKLVELSLALESVTAGFENITSSLSVNNFSKKIDEVRNQIQNSMTTQTTPDDNLLEWVNNLEYIQNEAEETGDKIKNALSISANADAGSALELMREAQDEQIEYERQLQAMYDESSQKREKVLREEQKYRDAIQRAKEKASSQDDKNTEKQLQQNQKLARSQETLARKIAEWRTRNSNAERDYGTALDELYNKLTSGAKLTEEELSQVSSGFDRIRASASQAGKTGSSVFAMIKQRAKSLIATLTTFNSFYDVVRIARYTINEIVSLDTALVDLRKTTSMNTAELEEFYKSSNNVAKQLGVTTEEIINQASSWSRLGYSTKEAATTMAALSSKFASISPGMTTDEAQTGLVSIMKAWDVATSDVERNIMDNINTLGNKFAETNLDIIKGMERAGATLSAIGTDINDSFALFTGAQEVLQNAETVGTALKTLSLRIRGYDEETEELSEDVIEATGKIASLTKVASNNFAGVSLWADAEQTKYRSLKDYLGDIAKIWDEIDEKSKTDLLEGLFGKRGASVGSAILGNFEQVERAILEMEDAAGSADREMGIIESSLEYKINALKETWVGIAQDLIERGAIGNIVDALTNISNIIGSITSNLGIMKTLLAGLGAVFGPQIGKWAKTLIESGTSLKDIFSGLLSRGISAAIGVGIGFVIDGISTVIDKLVVTKKEIQEIIKAGKDAAEVANNIQSTYKDQAKTVTEVKQRYAELSQGVKDLGKSTQSQGKLSTDEYNEFLDISKQLVEVFPTLNGGISDQGEQLTTLNGSVDTITGSLDNLLQVERELAAVEVKEKFGDIWGGYGTEVDQDIDAYNEALEKRQELQKQLEDIKLGFDGTLGEYFNYDASVQQDLAKAFESYGLDINDYMNVGFDNGQVQMILQSYFKGLIKTYDAETEKLKDKIETDNKNIADSFIGLLELDDDYYQRLDNASKEMVNSVLRSFSFDDAFNQLRDSDDWEDVYTQISKDIVQTFSDIPTEQMEGITSLFDTINNLSADDIDIQSYLDAVNRLKEILPTLSDDENVQKALLSIIPDDSEILAKIDHVKELLGDNWNDDYLKTLTSEELDFSATIKLKDKNYTIAELNKEIEDGINPVEIETEVKAASLVDTMADMKTAITSLNDLWEQTVNNRLKTGKDNKYLNEDGSVTKEINSQNYAEGFADPALLNSVESAFSKFINEAKDSGKDVEKLDYALSEFQETMVKTPGDATKAQKAIDNLITAYIDQTDAIQKLDESTKDWSIAQLKAMGIENAEEVVTTRLNKKIAELLKKTKDLASTLKQYDKALDLSNRGTEEWKHGIDEVGQKLTEMFSSLMEGSDVDLGNIFDEDFIVANLDAIKAAALGDVDAIQQLQKAAAQDIMMHVGLNIPDADVVNNIKNEINDLIAEFPIDDIEVGTALDDYPLIQGLNNLVNAGQITRDSMNAILASIGVKPDITYEDADIQGAIDAYGLKGSAAAAAGQSMKSMIKGKIKVPKIQYTMTNKASGARYGGSNNQSNDNKKGGGDNSSKSSEPNKPKEEAAETFDWIEVKLKRLEEAQQRLDRVVNNTYTTWSERNKSLDKELSNIEKQIKNNENAEKHYRKYAEKNVKINNGKDKVNPDDYGENDSLVMEADQKALDEAIKIWEQHTYQDLVQKGKIGKDDIEKISNKFLKEAISEYTQWWEKGIAAGEKAKDKAIEYLDKIKQRFEMVKTRYEQLVTLIQDKADIIDKKIARTQEKGFFVSNKYYEQLIKNESQQLNVLETERDKLIKERDKALAAGIKKTSEAYRNLEHDINTVNSAIEESKNQTIEWQNTIRQNNWDKFDYIEEKIARIKTEAQGLIDLFSNDKLYEDDGRLTDAGMATTGLYAIQWQTNQRQIKHYQDQLEILEGKLKDNPSDQTLISQYETWADATNELVKANEELKNSYKSLVEEGINQHLSNLDKIISKYQEITDAEKEAYDYQKNISKQVKNINELERMLNIYSGDDSEESRKNRQQLQTQLDEAKEALQETEWDKAISESKKLVSQMREDYEEFLQKRFDDIDELMKFGIGEANANTDDIVAAIEAEAKDTGYVITPEFQAVLDHSDDTEKSNLTTGTNEAVKAVKDYVNKMSDKEDMDSRENFKSEEEKAYETFRDQSKTYNDKRWEDVESATEKIKKNVEALNNVKTEAGRQKKQESINKSEATAYEKLDKLQANYQTQLEKLHALEDQGVNVDDELKEVEKLLIDVYNARAYIFNLLNSGKGGVQMGYMGYAKGSRGIKHDQLAWTQEEGQELIFRSSDGAMLTPLGAGDMVFTNEMTKKLFDFASGNLPVLTIPNVPTNSGNNINNNNSISITLPNVQNYDQFKAEMKKDTRLQSWMQEVTLGQAIGKNTLRRNSL